MEKAISQLKNGKSGGEDLLLNGLLIHGNSAMIKSACKIFNVIFQSGKFPEPWSKGHYLFHFFKRGTLISQIITGASILLSVLGKLLTRIMNNRLVTWAEEYRIYVEAQGGFRPGRGTVDNIFVLDGIGNSYLSSGKALYTAFIDFSKAFDYVVRDNLWYKLIQVGVRAKCSVWSGPFLKMSKPRYFFKGINQKNLSVLYGFDKETAYLPFSLPCI